MSNLLFFFDSETTGIPSWKTPSGGDDQPHIVQLAASLVDPDSQEVMDSIDLLVAPDGWDIPEEVVAIHGITTEHAKEHGAPEKEVLETFLDLWAGHKRVAFNTTFDNRIIRIATKRFCSDQVIDRWKAGEYECAMIGARKIMGGKNPTLAAAYNYFTGLEIQDAHNATADVAALIEVYFGIKRLRPESK